MVDGGFPPQDGQWVAFEYDVGIEFLTFFQWEVIDRQDGTLEGLHDVEGMVFFLVHCAGQIFS